MAKCSNLGYDFTRLDTGLKEIIMNETSSSPGASLSTPTPTDNGLASTHTAPSSHRLALSDDQSDWFVWRSVALRSAGFPADSVLKLSTPAAAEAADHVLRNQELAQQARASAFIVLQRAIDANGSHQEQRQRLVKALRQLKQGRAPQPWQDSGIAALDHYITVSQQAEAAWEAYRAIFNTEVQCTAQALAEIARTDRFREAVLWQNRRAFHTGVEDVLRHRPEDARDSQYRQHEVLVASYIQRYSVKNDTIGFFGPVGWASFAEQGPTVRMKPGERLLASRTVYFEAWCIQALATTLMQNPAVLPWLAPRLQPYLALEGTTLHIPGQAAIELAPEQAGLLWACDGIRRAKDIAQAILCMPGSTFTDEQAVYQLFTQLQQMGLLLWQFDIPVEPGADAALREQLARIGDEPLREAAQSALEELEQGRRAIAQAAGNPERLDEQIQALEMTFTRLTNQASTRAEGRTYAARTLVYEDCRRDIELTLGPGLLSALGAPLELLLTSARWFTYHAAAIYRQALTKLYHTIVQATGSPVVNAAVFWQQARPLLFGEGPHPIDGLLANFQERWASILALPEEVRAVHYASGQLREKVHELFAAPEPGWYTARHHSPDIMLAATSAEAIARGDYQLVLGEIHMGANTLNPALFMAQHPSPKDVLQMMEVDIPETLIVPIPPSDWPGLTTRTSLALVAPKDIRVNLSPDVSRTPALRSIPIGELVLEDTGNGLHVRTRDGQLHLALIEVFARALSSLTADLFKMLRPAPHTPRVTIDRLTISRETWTCSATDLTFAFEKTEAQRFVAARYWMRTHSMPRFVFVKAPVESKPFYVDFASPVYVEPFAKAARRTVNAGSATPMTVTEMLPEPHQAWLTDAEGQRYTCELRCVTFDMRS